MAGTARAQDGAQDRAEDRAQGGAAERAGHRGEPVVLSLSEREVLITTSFSGAEITIFGVAEPMAQDGPQPDVVVTVRGPEQTFLTWRKSQVVGLWMNTDSRAFRDVPGFLRVLSSRPAALLAAPEVLRAEQIGLDRFPLLRRAGPDPADAAPPDPFRAAFLRIQASHQLYQEDPAGVTFIAPNVFQARLSLPGHAPIGRYEVHLRVLRAGQVVGEARTHFDVARTGFEQSIAAFAHTNGILYGISVALGSLVVGFFANLLFRKE
ncbi:TIGR02186 family protein [Xanthobacter sp. KR7-225]|uniref:TIGR02186 family protein n=1 Tax=Xanthobacter sp. KR7-225 TaxID=3156613 RepID=UPI0032B5CB8B